MAPGISGRFAMLGDGGHSEYNHTPPRLACQTRVARNWGCLLDSTRGWVCLHELSTLQEECLHTTETETLGPHTDQAKVSRVTNETEPTLPTAFWLVAGPVAARAGVGGVAAMGWHCASCNSAAKQPFKGP